MTTLIFVHGLANGPAYRKTILERMKSKAPKDLFDSVVVAQWRSRGSWSADVTDLGHPDGIRAEEAVEDVLGVFKDVVVSGEPVVVVGHSMGSILALLAIQRVQTSRWSLVTVGSPLGNPVLRAGIYTQGWSRRVEQPCPVPWVDVWNREDPICADILLGHQNPVGCPKNVQVNAPGHPSVADPLAEHGAYFDLPAFWAVVKEAAGVPAPAAAPVTTAARIMTENVLSEASKAIALETLFHSTDVGEHVGCKVVSQNPLAVCPCECRVCKRAYFAAGQPTVRDGKIVRRPT